MITFASPDLLKLDTYGLTFIYQLCDNNIPFYVGSSRNPVSRLSGHLCGKTKNTRKRIEHLLSKGRELTMQIVDACNDSDRIWIEAKWINETPEADNTTRYDSHYHEHLKQPRPCISEGTLTPQFKDQNDH